MPSKEEYLDNLLKGLINEQDQMFSEDSPNSNEPVAGDDSIIAQDIAVKDDFVISEENAVENPVIVEEPVIKEAVMEEPFITEDSPITEEPDIIEEPVAEEPVDEDFFNTDNISELMAQEGPAVIDDVSDEDKFDIGDLDSVLNNASEEDIEKILNENRENSYGKAEAESSEELSDGDIADLFNASGEDEDLTDINDMLQKSDSNEAIDEDVLAMLQNIPDEEVDIFAEDEKEDEAFADVKSRRAEEKRLKREEKKEAKRLAKEAKKAKKEAKKAARGKVKAVEETENKEDLSPDDSNTDVSAEMDAFLNGALSDDEQSAQEPGVAEIDLTEAGIGDMFVRTVEDSEEHDADALVDGIFSLEDVVDEINEESHKKRGFFAKLMDFLTEEDEEDEDTGNAEIRLSEENQNIIDELDSESGDGKKGKKSKKGKKAKKEKKGNKDKKGNNGDKEEDVGGEEISPSDDKKGKKAKKEKKPKKERNLEPNDEKPSKKLSTKRMLLIALICLSILAVIILSTNLVSDYSVKKTGRQAFSDGDYQTCYQSLYGKNLNESEQVMFSKSECILRVRLWIREYEMFADEGSEVEALDSLIQSVNDYPALYEYAVQWNSVAEVSEVYAQMLEILSSRYGLTEEQAREIAAEPDDIEYTRKVTAVAEGKSYNSADTFQESADVTEPLKDILPEEEGMVNANFVDNM